MNTQTSIPTRVKESLPAIYKVIREAEDFISAAMGVKVKLCMDIVQDYAWHKKVADAVCDYFHFDWIEIVSKKRDRDLVAARQCIIYFIYQPGVAGCSVVSIADMLHRDHTTVSYHIEKVHDLLRHKDPIITIAINALKKTLTDENDKN